LGQTFGVGYEPFELSAEGSKDYLSKSLTPLLEGRKDYLRRLKTGEVDKINIAGLDRPPKYIVPTDLDWDRVLKRTIDAVEHDIKYIQMDVDVYKRLVQHWKVRPLPKEGERHIDWYTQGQRG